MGNINESIFRAYDIRGVYPDEINEEAVFNIVAALVKFLNPDKLVVAQDSRPSSGSLREAVITAITASGVDVIDIGQATSPLFYFAVNKLSAAGGVMVTASHNPPNYSGLKLVREKAIAISGKNGLNQIKNQASEIKIEKIKKGRVVRRDLSKDYSDYLLEKSGLTREPKAENISFEFDPDSDRLLIYEKDKKIRSDLLSGIVIKDFLERKNLLSKIFGGPKFVYDLRFTKAIPEYIKENGGVAVRSRVGHVFIKEKMREHKAVFGAELSGHFYFKDTFYTESPVLMKLKLLKIMEQTGKSLAELAKPFEKYFHSGEISFKIENLKLKIGKLMQELKKQYRDGRLDDLDGLTVNYPDFWFNLRPSQTEPVLRLVVEAKAKYIMEQKLKEIEEIVTPH